GSVKDTTVFYWVDIALSGATVGLSTRKVLDVANDTVVMLDSTYELWTWDSGDRFDSPTGPITMAAFETALDGGAVFWAVSYTVPGISTFEHGV
ncbi:MAG: hypothetical protein QGM47_11235, partial [Actinomycetota bacterium]|nr:hypothetical protein [Actinomycetota bacterium]